jgi:O-succinylbenzoic acid--CoA ligase
MKIHFLSQATHTTRQQVEAFVSAWQSGQEVFTLHTSGSTGISKEIKVPRTYMEASALATAQAIGLERNKDALICLNTKYIGGIMALVRGMVLDWDMYLTEPSANPLAEIAPTQQLTLNNHPPTFYHASLVPLQLEATLADDAQRAQLSAMHSVLVGGAAISTSLQETASKVNGVAIYQTFGMTETVSHFALRRLNGPVPEEAYTLLPGFEAQIDANNCLQIAGPTTGGAWLATQDMVELVGERQFTWLGRADFVINSGGIKLNPDTLEPLVGKILQEMGVGGNYYLTGRPHDTLGQELALVLEGATNPDLDVQILMRLKQALPPYSAPRSIIWAKEIPKTATGKIRRL